MVPVNELIDKSKYCSLVRLAKASGMVPEKELLWKSNNVMVLYRDNACGRVPKNKFPRNCTVNMISQLLYSAGIVPVRRFLATEKPCNSLKME